MSAKDETGNDFNPPRPFQVTYFSEGVSQEGTACYRGAEVRTQGNVHTVGTDFLVGTCRSEPGSLSLQIWLSPFTDTGEHTFDYKIVLILFCPGEQSESVVLSDSHTMTVLADPFDNLFTESLSIPFPPNFSGKTIMASLTVRNTSERNQENFCVVSCIVSYQSS